MTDMEKVIKGLICCQYSSKSHCDECPYCYEELCETNDCTADLASDAIELLKEQEPVEADTKTVGMPNGCDIEVFCCRNCRFPVDISFHYCPNCGQAVIWK